MYCPIIYIDFYPSVLFQYILNGFIAFALNGVSKDEIKHAVSKGFLKDEQRFEY